MVMGESVLFRTEHRIGRSERRCRKMLCIIVTNKSVVLIEQK